MTCAAPCCVRTTFAVVDTETTGLSPHTNRIVEVAVATCNPDGAVTGLRHTLINPQGAVGATRIHGITAADVTGAPTFADIAGDLLDALAGHTFVAHNAPFDLAFLRAELARAGADLPTLPVLDTRRACTVLGTRGQSLDAVTGALGLSRTGKLHGAGEDVTLTAAVLAAILNHHRRNGTHIGTLDGLAPGATLPHRVGAWPALRRGARGTARTR